MLKLHYQYEHDGLVRWLVMDYIKDQHTNRRNWMLHHPEAYFEYV